METWRAVPGYEGLYEVSDAGGIRSLRRSVVDQHGKVRRTGGKTLRNTSPHGDYVRVTLYRAGVPHQTRLHVLVAAAFLGPRPLGMEVAHNDGTRTNNRLSNLRYATVSENQMDRRRHGTSNAHDRHGRAVLTSDDVAQIRRQLTAGVLQRAIAASFGVTPSNISMIARGHSWRPIDAGVDREAQGGD